MKVHFSGRSMPRVLVNGEVVRAEVLPRQRAHQDPPQGREGAAGNLSIHFAGSHIIHVFVVSVDKRARGRCNVPGGNASNPRPAWRLLRLLHRNDVIRVPERIIKLGCRQSPGDPRGASTRDEVSGFHSAACTSSRLHRVIRRSHLRPINVRANEVIPANGY